MLIFEQQTSLEHTVNEGKIVLRIFAGFIALRRDCPQLCPEVEVMACPARQTVSGKVIAERALPRAARAEKQDGIDGKCVGILHYVFCREWTRIFTNEDLKNYWTQTNADLHG